MSPSISISGIVGITFSILKRLRWGECSQNPKSSLKVILHLLFEFSVVAVQNFHEWNHLIQQKFVKLQCHRQKSKFGCGRMLSLSLVKPRGGCSHDPPVAGRPWPSSACHHNTDLCWWCHMLIFLCQVTQHSPLSTHLSQFPAYHTVTNHIESVGTLLPSF